MNSTAADGDVGHSGRAFVLSNADRYYDADFLSYLGAGRRLPADAIARLKAHLQEDKLQCEQAMRDYSRAL